MNAFTSENKIVMTRRFVKKFLRSIDAIGCAMHEDDLMQISIFNNTVLIESDDMSTVIKLEKQD